jgi:vitamin B12 transporter
LGRINVTATRTARTVDDTLASVSVITRTDIERMQALSLQDVLEQVPGLEIANSGGQGKATSVFLRGTNSDQVLVLIDGIKVGSATAGTTAFQDIPVGQIQRIEVVRGPRSSLYGSDAIGGVIQIFTRRGEGPPTLSANIGGGTYHTFRTGAGISGGGKRGWYNLSASHFYTAGFNSCSGKPFPNGAGCFTFEPDDDGYRNTSVDVGAGYRFENGTGLEAHLLRSTGYNEFDGTTVNAADFLHRVAGGKIGFAPVAFWHAQIAAGDSENDATNFLNGARQSDFNTDRRTISWQNNFTLAANHLLIVGVDYRHDQLDSDVSYAETARHDSGYFAEYEGHFGAERVQGSVRYDDDSQFGGKTTGSVAWGYAFDNGLRLRASYGTAFDAPTFNDLYYPGFANPNLGPENSRSIELGLNDRMAWGNWNLSLYQTKINDLIALNSATGAPANIDSARIRGLEAGVSTNLFGWRARFDLTLLNPENHGAGPNHGNRLPRRTRRKETLDLDRRFGNFHAGATVLNAGPRYDDLANTRRLGGFTTVAIRAAYDVTPRVQIQASIKNILDENYETVAFYNQAGRNFFVSVRYQPGD